MGKRYFLHADSEPQATGISHLPGKIQPGAAHANSFRACFGFPTAKHTHTQKRNPFSFTSPRLYGVPVCLCAVSDFRGVLFIAPIQDDLGFRVNPFVCIALAKVRPTQPHFVKGFTSSGDGFFFFLLPSHSFSSRSACVVLAVRFY